MAEGTGLCPVGVVDVRCNAPASVQAPVSLSWGGRARSHTDAGNSNVFERVFEEGVAA